MSKEPKTETSVSGPPTSLPVRAALFWVLGMAAVVVLTINVWLLSSQVSRMTQSSRERAFWALCHSGTTSTQRTECFLQLVADGNTEWKSAKLEMLDLTGADLSSAELEGAVFSSCELVEADFTDALLNKAGLDNSNISKSVFAGAKIRNATFFKSELAEADFRNADLLSTSFEQARVHGATFVAAKMGDAFLAMTDMTGSDFTGADLSGANLEAAIMKNTNLALANLYGTQLVDTDFTDSNWWRARGLSSAQLDHLTVEYAPTADSTESRQRDFSIWLTKRLEDGDRERPASE